MLVDDSAIVRGFMRRWIDEDPRIELVKACSDGAQAVAEAANIRPDVIVLDIEMPNMDGLALCTQALITPSLVEGPAQWPFWFFWATHGMIFAVPIYDIIARGYRPNGSTRCSSSQVFALTRVSPTGR